MKKILFALTAVAALGATHATFAQSVGAKELANTQALITELQSDKRQVMLDTLALNPEQLKKFTPIYDEYEAEMKKLMTDATNLNNRLFVADYGGMTDKESKDIMKAAFKLRHERLNLLEKYRGQARQEAAGDEGGPVRPDREQDPGAARRGRGGVDPARDEDAEHDEVRTEA